MHPRKIIERYVSEGLPKRREEALRRHLGRCESCLSHYEEQIRLVRALRGDVSSPTPDEEARLLSRIVTAAAAEGLLEGAQQPSKESRAPESATKEQSWLTWLADRVVLHPAPSAAAAFSVALVFAAALLVVTGNPLPGTSPPVAFVVEARGTEIGGTALEVDEARGRAVRDGDVMSTTAEGLAEISLESGGGIRLFPGTRATFEDGGRTVALDIGRVWCSVESSDDPFVVRTPGGEARVLGTSFVVEHSAAGRTDVRVITGHVEVVDHEGRGRVEVPAGQRTSVAQGRAPARPVAYDVASDSAEWDSLWSRIMGALQRAFESLRGLFQRGE